MPIRCAPARAIVVLAAVTALASCGGDTGSSTQKRPGAGKPAPAPAGPRLYVTNEMSGDMTVIDVPSRRAVGTIRLGKRPRGIRVSPDGNTLYVALSGSPIAPPGVDENTLPAPDRAADGIGVVDRREGRLLRIIHAGTDPEQLAVSRDGRWLFVANEDAAQASVVDATDGRIIARIRVGGEPEGVDLRPDGKVVYVTAEEDNHVYVIDALEPRLITRFEVGPRPRSTGFLPDSSRAYIGAENGASVTVVDAMAHRVLETIKLAGQVVRPMGVLASPDGHHVFVTTGRGGAVVTIDTATNRPIGSVDVGERPWGIAVSDDGRTLFTANGPSNDVSFVDIASRTVIARIKVGERPWGVAFVQ